MGPKDLQLLTNAFIKFHSSSSTFDSDTELAWWHRPPSTAEIEYRKETRPSSSSFSSSSSSSYSSSSSSSSPSAVVSPLHNMSMTRVWGQQPSHQVIYFNWSDAFISTWYLIGQNFVGQKFQLEKYFSRQNFRPIFANFVRRIFFR